MAKDRKNRKKSTSWEGVGKWYNKTVGTKGMHYHQTIVMPGVLRLLALDNEEDASILDIACGQGIMSRHLPKKNNYTGLDISPKLIQLAKDQCRNSKHQFHVADATKKFPLEKDEFTHATIILALQNIEDPALALKNAAKHLKVGGKLIIVMNHPCYRIPRQSSWGVDENKKIQFRRLDSYMSSQKIPIIAEPSKGAQSATTISFHHPLTNYFEWLFASGFAVEKLEEWCSDKSSTGSKAKMENRARNEFPLFLCMRAIKLK